MDEFSEFKKRFKKIIKADLFPPIFYSFVFGGVIFGAAASPDLELWKIILGVVLAAILSLVFWLNYFWEKRQEKQMNLTLENLGRDEGNEKDESDYLTPQEAEMMQTKLLSFLRTQIFVIAGNALFSLLVVVAPQIMDFPPWARTLSLVLWILFLFISGGLLFVKCKKVGSFLKSQKEEK